MTRCTIAAALWMAMVVVVGSLSLPAAAQEIGYLGENSLDLESVSRHARDGSGKGIVDYRGGDEPDSQWRASFRFNHLRPDKDYVVVIQGRFGELESSEAEEFTELCSFTTNEQGKGSCFWYFQGLARLDLVQLRLKHEDGRPIMEATREGGPGAITTDPNRFSPGGEIPAREASRKGKKAK